MHSLACRAQSASGTVWMSPILMEGNITEVSIKVFGSAPKWSMVERSRVGYYREVQSRALYTALKSSIIDQVVYYQEAASGVLSRGLKQGIIERFQSRALIQFSSRDYRQCINEVGCYREVKVGCCREVSSSVSSRGLEQGIVECSKVSVLSRGQVWCCQNGYYHEASSSVLWTSLDVKGTIKGSQVGYYREVPIDI